MAISVDNLSTRLGEYHKGLIKTAYPSREYLDSYYQTNKHFPKPVLEVMETLDITYSEVKDWLYGKDENK